jgi:hypothetical protein
MSEKRDRDGGGLATSVVDIVGRFGTLPWTGR